MIEAAGQANLNILNNEILSSPVIMEEALIFVIEKILTFKKNS